MQSKQFSEIASRHVAFVMIAYAVILIFVILNSYFEVIKCPLLILLFFAGSLGGITNMFSTIKKNKNLNVDDSQLFRARLQVYASVFIAGVFGVIIYGFFVSGLVTGEMFPSFNKLATEYSNVNDLLKTIEPATQQDAAKALVWAFIAGFSEKLVPNLIEKKSKEGEASHPPA